MTILHERMKAVDARPTEEELQAIARAAYGERLAQFCDEQRAAPQFAAEHSIANLAWADYYDRLARNGGHVAMLPGECSSLASMGWDDQRIAALCTAIEHAVEGNPPISRRFIDHHLRERGYEPHNGLRRMVERVLYPAYRDACIQAEAQLQSNPRKLAFAGAEPLPREALDAHLATPAKLLEPAVANEQAIPDSWRSCTPIQAAERLIADTPRMFEHRQGGKRAREQVGEQTLRQIRWAATLLEKSLPAGTPLWKVTKQDITRLDAYFDQLPIAFGKSPADRDPSTTLADAVSRAADAIEEGELSPEDVGLKTGTTNKHFNKLGQIHKFMCDQVEGARPIDFSKFTMPIDEDEREARLRYTVEQGRALFGLAPWVGCSGPDNRLTPGREIIHDGLFFVLLLVWYTGARREELCKLMLADVEQRHGVAYLLIRPTETGRLKNKSARRVIVLCEEIKRLGFLRYVEAMRAEGEGLLFPELMPASGTKRKLGDVFYKNWWIYLKPLVPDLKRGQAMHSARHMVADELKDQEVFIEFRNDHLGHKGKGEGETRYPSAASLARLTDVVEKIPVVTNDLPDQTDIRLLPSAMRTARPKRERLA